MKSTTSSAAGTRPVLPGQVPDSVELPGVRRDQGRAAPTRLPGQQDVVRSDWFPGRFKLGPNGSCLAGVFFVELRPFKGASEECFQALPVGLLALTLADAVPKLEG